MAVLTIRGVRSYGADRDVSIDLSSKVTLIYGQNGSGKSTISNFFAGYYPEKYGQCRFESPSELSALVFNQDYIERKFSQENVQPGIFTLSEHNHELQEKIYSNQKRLNQIGELVAALNAEIRERGQIELKITEDCAARIFKRTSAERNRFAQFLSGAKQQKNFFERIRNIPLSAIPLDPAELSARLEMLLKSRGTRFTELAYTPPGNLILDLRELIRSPLQPSSGTQFSDFIARMGSADWVHAGEQYIHDDTCPFCQNTFDHRHFIEEMARMYDTTYQNALDNVKEAAAGIARDIEMLDELHERLIRHPLVIPDDAVFSALKSLSHVLRNNLQIVKHKTDKPAAIFELQAFSTEQDHLAYCINRINLHVSENNRLAANYEAEMSLLSDDVNACLRQISDEYLLALSEELTDVREARHQKELTASALLTERRQLGEETSQLTGKLSVIQPAIDSINRNLLALGVSDFSICCHDEKMKLYRLQRESAPGDSEVFRSLSEGEKTIISLLYFIESCTGNLTPEAVMDGRKLIIIDDPISSLSHNYIYEVASLIKRRLIKPETAKHLVILTHNMFFFQEILLTAVRRLDSKLDAPKGWSLLRIIKNEHSDCLPLSMHEMLNEYQALWQTLKDVRDNRSQLIVLPNTMRNILEYYFSFSCKEEKLEKTLETLAANHSAGRYDSFYRAVNRHSHSDGRNILGSGIMEKGQYFKLFKKIFEEMDDLEHYCKMMDEQV